MLNLTQLSCNFFILVHEECVNGPSVSPHDRRMSQKRMSVTRHTSAIKPEILRYAYISMTTITRVELLTVTVTDIFLKLSLRKYIQ